MGKKSLKEARKVSRVYTTEEMLEILKKNEQFKVTSKIKKKDEVNNGY